MTAVDVLSRALELAHRDHFDCPYCACAKAKTQLDREAIDEHWGEDLMADTLATFQTLREALTSPDDLLPSDRPLTDATDALLPYLREIVGCPSPMSDERMREVLSNARYSLMT